MAGANMNGLAREFGEDALFRIKGCEFHFKDNRNKMANKLDKENGDVLKTLCDDLLTANLQET